MALRKNSPYTPFMKRMMRNVIYSGHLKRLISKYDSMSSKECILIKDPETNSLSYQKLLTVFTIIGVGTALSFLFLILEIVIGRTKLKTNWNCQNSNQEITKPGMVNCATQTNNLQFEKKPPTSICHGSKIPRPSPK